MKDTCEVTGRLDLNEFVRRVGLTSSRTMKHMQELQEAGFLRAIAGGYGIIDAGRVGLKAFSTAQQAWSFFTFHLGSQLAS